MRRPERYPGTRQLLVPRSRASPDVSRLTSLKRHSLFNSRVCRTGVDDIRTGNSPHITPAHRRVGIGPMVAVAAGCYSIGMGLILLIVVLLILFGGGGFYFGGPIIGGSGLGLVLLICLIIFLMGGFRSRS